MAKKNANPKATAKAPPISGSPAEAMIAALDRPDVRALRKALKAGADPNSDLHWLPGWPLSLAMRKRHWDNGACVLALLKAGADPNSYVSPYVGGFLAQAAFDGDLPILNALLAAGADPELTDTPRNRPIARSGSQINCLRALLAAGASPLSIQGRGSPLVRATACPTALGFLLALIPRSAILAGEAQEALNEALAAASPSAVQTLLRAGANPIEPDARGEIPLLHALSHETRVDEFGHQTASDRDDGDPEACADLTLRAAFDTPGFSGLESLAIKAALASRRPQRATLIKERAPALRDRDALTHAVLDAPPRPKRSTSL